MGLTSRYDTRTLERPTCPIPLDRVHEFFNVPLRYDDAAVLSWITHFQRTGVSFRRVDRDGRVQLYLHRVRLRFNSTAIEQWCCSGRERK